MKKTIYISGPITDNRTGQPRDGWQKDFLDAEAKLREIGFLVMNPIDIAREVEDAKMWKHGSCGGACECSGRPSRADYIMGCLERMKMGKEFDMLHGVYLIGDVNQCVASHGVQMELHMAEILDIPVFAEFRSDSEIWTDDLRLRSEKTISELL